MDDDDGDEEEEGRPHPGFRSDMEMLQQLVRAHRRMRQIAEQVKQQQEITHVVGH